MLHAIIAEGNKELLLDLTHHIENKNVGIKVVGAVKDEEEILNQVRKFMPELIILDRSISKKNYLKCIKKIREIDLSSIIIVLTNPNDMNIAQMAIEYDVVVYLTKPIDYNVFDKTITKCINYYTKVISTLKQLNIYNQNKYGTISIIKFINENYNNSYMSIKLLEEKFNLSRTSIYCKIKKETGLNFSSYLTKLRMESAKKLLLNEEYYSIKIISDIIGYSDQHYFTHVFKSNIGLAPLEYRKIYLEP